jgi:hypothetical protein
MILFSTLTTRVGDGVVECSFGSSVIRRRIDLATVTSASVVKNRWYGLGIKRIRDGWLWNVGGPGAVEIRFRDGRCFRVGTDEPERLLAAIEAERSLDGRAARQHRVTGDPLARAE